MLFVQGNLLILLIALLRNLAFSTSVSKLEHQRDDSEHQRHNEQLQPIP